MMVRSRHQFRARDHELFLGDETRVMGIINVTPDSFSGDGQWKGPGRVRRILRLACQMARDGADMIDIGGESTRPGAAVVSSLEECRRVVPVIEAIIAHKPGILVSVDTFKADVARQALRAGAHVVNVVRANTVSGKLLQAVGAYDAGLILMHSRGTPRTMQKKTGYACLVADIVEELHQSVGAALGVGIKPDRLMIDPGIGFAKTAEQSFTVINKLALFYKLGFPVLVGPSRKSFIGKTLDQAPDKRLFGTIAAVVVSVVHGAHMVRVHDVREVKEAVMIADAILNGGK